MIKRHYMLIFLLCFVESVVQARTIALYAGLTNQKQHKIDISKLQPSQYSFHFLLTTIGRKSIFKMLKSLKEQVNFQDYVTIVFDAKDVDSVLEEVKEYVSDFNCVVTLIFEEKNLGYWGHGIRNKYANDLQGDFILHCDDDNAYISNAISSIRKICKDPNILYLFRIKTMNRLIWKEPKIYSGNIDTACGVIPNKYNRLGRWEYFYGGDGAFYKTLSSKIDSENIVFVDFPIYQWRP